MDPFRLIWAGGEHDVTVHPVGILRRLQATLDSGPEEVFNRIRLGNWRDADLTEVVRLGLIGGGMDEDAARTLVNRTAAETAWANLKMAAHKIMSHAVVGPADDKVGKPVGAAETDNPAAPENGALASSTAPAPSSGSRRSKSTK